MGLTKHDVVACLDEIALLLELCGENPFKARSYTNVARQIEQLEDDLAVLAAEKRLREIKGVGEALEKKLEELINTGCMQYHAELRARFPLTLFELFRIPSLGAKRIKVLYDALGVKSLGELEYACHENRLIGLKGFGPRMQEKLLEGIAFTQRQSGLHLFDKAYDEGERLLALLKAHPEVQRVAVAGSLRRRKEIIKDIDLVASSRNPQAVMDAFVHADGVASVTGHGDTKSSVVLAAGMAADLRVVSDEQFPYTLCHFTGSKEHNVGLRQRAREWGLKLNEYGLFRNGENIPCADETALYAALDLPFIPPELREDRGELDLHETPRLVEREDLKGLVHIHTTYSDGKATLDQMVEAAKSLGYAYIAIADHSQSAAYAGGLSPARVAEQQTAIDALNEKVTGIRILKGIESDIRMDGSLDYEQDVLDTFDFVIASIHSKLEMTEDEATARVVRAIEQPSTTILGHPTGRLLLARQGYPLDFEKVFDACRANHVAVEINASPQRLDLDWRHIRRAKEKGLKLCIGPDAHSVEAIGKVFNGVAIARKGWLGPEDLLNALTAEEFLAWCRSK
jgi:DNA polymerase (family 10)